METTSTSLTTRSTMALVHQPREQYYRFEETMHTECRMALNMMAFIVLKRTPCGVWIDTWGTKKFVNNNAHKRYAWATKEAALESFRARKRRQARLLRHQLLKAETALTLSIEEPHAYLNIYFSKE